MDYVKRLALAQLLFWPLISISTAKSSVGGYQDHGRATLSGSITGSACAIDTNSQDQSLNLGVISAAEIQQFGHGSETPFAIKLINCTLVSSSKTQPNWSYFSVTFDGNYIDGDLFGLDGDARGFGLYIKDEYGNSALPGQAMPAGIIDAGSIVLNYRLRLQKDNNSLQAGSYHTVIRYQLEYY
ncbi:MrfB family protein [Buttiauxella brennerae ATCC 51605]|uniref:MrfB family protein n=1 Tax=Buttiauxella brennerae ATCC 51605 TaxID=1354251 RepID=A0A1B7INL2_9ENTR|nr:fimbrial protein [Buttiauxella brennerae]OAT31262.1 MrfB family protein [Buttiauxella brennerae ATCC 51605]